MVEGSAIVHANRNGEGLVKVIFPLNESDWGALRTETMWAKPLGKSLYRLDNIPFYVYGISAEDVISTISDQNSIFFSQVEERGGHSTFRILLNENIRHDASVFKRRWPIFRDLGCSYEVAGPTWIAIDVPSNSDINRVKNLLEEGEHEGIWEWFDGYVAGSVGNTM